MIGTPPQPRGTVYSPPPITLSDLDTLIIVKNLNSLKAIKKVFILWKPRVFTYNGSRLHFDKSIVIKSENLSFYQKYF